MKMMDINLKNYIVIFFIIQKSFVFCQINNFPNGIIEKKTILTDSVKIKKTLEYYENGKVKRELLFCDTILFKSMEWFENGNIKQEINYSKSKWLEQEGVEKQFYENGKIQKEGFVFGVSFIKDTTANESISLKILNGYWSYYYENGNIDTEFSILNGYKNGLYKEYYTNGNRKFFGFYLNGLRNGVFRYYDSSGKLVNEEIYKNDKLIELKYPTTQ